MTQGGFPSIYHTWSSTQHNGILSNCRSGIISLSTNVGVGLRQESGQTYSDSDHLTTWSVFSVSMLMNRPGSLLYASLGDDTTTFDSVGSPVSINEFNTGIPAQYNLWLKLTVIRIIRISMLVMSTILITQLRARTIADSEFRSTALWP